MITSLMAGKRLLCATTRYEEHCSLQGTPAKLCSISGRMTRMNILGSPRRLSCAQSEFVRVCPRQHWCVSDCTLLYILLYSPSTEPMQSRRLPQQQIRVWCHCHKIQGDSHWPSFLPSFSSSLGLLESPDKSRTVLCRAGSLTSTPGRDPSSEFR